MEIETAMVALSRLLLHNRAGIVLMQQGPILCPVQCIASRVHGGELQYLIRPLGVRQGLDTWVSRHRLLECDEKNLILMFLQIRHERIRLPAHALHVWVPKRSTG